MSIATSDHTSAHAHAPQTEGHHEEGEVHVHVNSPLFMIAIFAALIVLTVLTVAVSYVDLGSANTFVAILVATMKATLVATFFMHLKGDKAIHSIIFIGSFVFLIIFVGLTNDDLSTRSAVDIDNGSHRLERSGDIAPGGLRIPAAPAGATPSAAGAAAPAEHH